MTAQTLSSRLVGWLFIGLYQLRGWRIDGRPPAAKKFILVGAPHTSNWDFAVFLGATHELGIRASYLGKHSLFRWPARRCRRSSQAGTIGTPAPTAIW